MVATHSPDADLANPMTRSRGAAFGFLLMAATHDTPGPLAFSSHSPKARVTSASPRPVLRGLRAYALRYAARASSSVGISSTGAGGSGIREGLAAIRAAISASVGAPNNRLWLRHDEISTSSTGENAETCGCYDENVAVHVIHSVIQVEPSALLDALIVRNVEIIRIRAARAGLSDLHHAAIVSVENIIVVVLVDLPDRDTLALVFSGVTKLGTEGGTVAALVDGLRALILVVSAQERPIPIGAGGNGGHTGRAFLVRFIAGLSGFCFMADRPGEAGLRHS
ncbi:hypothetical protein NT26_p10103 (plasmid) [Pseudorhizobium banfieldiae]|uniref:Uncharacterized protein n=1 Tax=Pseudorhizobium banfieldiae TaxID=1125847 RepID=L0NM19_9HYPH|nr:hypothetical protein NT26_p10103 [Pseudorhizobium banfieldiae]